MKNLENVRVVFQDGEEFVEENAEVIRGDGVLTVFTEHGTVARANWDFVAYYITEPAAKNLDEE